MPWVHQCQAFVRKLVRFWPSSNCHLTFTWPSPDQSNCLKVLSKIYSWWWVWINQIEVSEVYQVHKKSCEKIQSLTINKAQLHPGQAAMECLESVALSSIVSSHCVSFINLWHSSPPPTRGRTLTPIKSYFFPYGFRTMKYTFWSSHAPYGTGRSLNSLKT